MQASDKASFQKLLTDVMAFYRQDVSTFALSVWWQACESFDIEQVRKAMTAHAMDPEHGKFAPKPADVIRQLQGTHTDRALVAWGKVHDAMGRVGAYRSVVFDDPAIHAAIVDMGGWPALCRSDVDALPFTQKRFCELYRSYSARPGHGHPPKLLGDHDIANSAKGFQGSPPALVGDPKRALAVLEGGSVEKTRITSAKVAELLEFKP